MITPRRQRIKAHSHILEQEFKTQSYSGPHETQSKRLK